MRSPLGEGAAPLEGWRYSPIVSGIQVPNHVYSEFAFSAIVISSEAEKPLSVFIYLTFYLTYFPRETLNPSQQKSTCTLRHMCFFHYLRLNVTGTCELQVIATPFCLAGTNCQP